MNGLKILNKIEIYFIDKLLNEIKNKHIRHIKQAH